MQEIIVSEYNPKARKFPDNAFCIAFVYAESGNFVVKGFSGDVHKHVENNFPKSLVNLTWWHKGTKRSFWKFTHDDIYIKKITSQYWAIHKNELKRNRGWVVWKYVDRELPETLYFRRLPKKWIKEFDVQYWSKRTRGGFEVEINEYNPNAKMCWIGEIRLSPSQVFTCSWNKDGKKDFASIDESEFDLMPINNSTL
jgi:hypothetical protein